MPSSPALPRFALFHLLLTAGIYFCGVAFLMHFPRYVLALGGTTEDAGWLLALGLVPALLLAAPVGEWNRRHGGRGSAVAGCGLVVVSSLLMPAVEKVDIGLYAVRMLFAVGHTFIFATLFTQAALLTDAPLQRVKVIGWLAVVIQVGNALGGLVGEQAFLAGVTTYWWGCAAFALCAAVLGAFFPVPRVAPRAAPMAKDGARSPWPVEVWAVAAIAMAFAGLTQFMPTFIEHIARTGQAAEPFAAAWFITPALLVVAAVRLVGGVFTAGLLRRRVLRGCHAMLVLTVLLLPWIGSRTEALVLAVAFGLSYGWLYPALNGLAFQNASPESRGRVAGVLVNAFEIGFRLGTVGLGALIVHVGYPGMFLGLALLYVAVMAWGWCLQRRRDGILIERTAPE